MAARYFDAIKWIAFNDDAGFEGDAHAQHKHIEGMTTVCLVADIFGKTVREVTTDVIRCRAYNSPNNTLPIPTKYRVEA